MKKGIIFDMDGVLVDSEYFYQQRRIKFLEEIGYHTNVSYDFTGSNEKAIWEALVSDDMELREKMKQEYRNYQCLYPVDYKKLLNPKVKELLEELHNRKIKTAIASSSCKEAIVSMMQAAEIEDLVDYVISGEECKEHKPAPEIYWNALNGLGLNADEALAVEDSATGIAAAKNAGLFTCALKPCHGEPLDQSAADIVITQLNQVLCYL